MKAVVAACNQEKALVGAFSVISDYEPSDGTFSSTKIYVLCSVVVWCGWSQVTQSNNLYKTTTFTILAPTLETAVHCVKIG